MDNIDRQLVKLTQKGLPLVAEPYRQLAEYLSISKTEVIERLEKMKQQGVIRRIAAVPNHYKLGYRFNGMSVWNVDDMQIDRLGQLVGQLDFVSHCYQRPRHLPDWPYNLFAMLHSQDKEGVERHAVEIAALLGEYQQGYEILYSSRILKKRG